MAADADGQGLGQRGLANAGDVLDEGVAAGQQAEHGQADLVVLADQDALHIAVQVSRQLRHGVDGRCRRRVAL